MILKYRKLHGHILFHLDPVERETISNPSKIHKNLNILPVSSEISDLCEISDLLFFVSYFASQSKGIKFGNYFFDVCCVFGKSSDTHNKIQHGNKFKH